MSPQKKLQIKTGPDTTTHNILTYKVVLIETWRDFKYYYSFRYAKASFVLQFYHIKVSFWSVFSFNICKSFF